MLGAFKGSNKIPEERIAPRNIMRAREKDKELASIDNHQLFGYMQDNERLFSQVAAPQEAVMDAILIKHLSRLCRQQAEQMSANIVQFRHEEYVERLVASMRGRADSPSYSCAT